MAGVSVDEGGKGGRRSLDSELNMIPMIDLLMVTISFLLITAVWTQMGRVEARADVPGGTQECPSGVCPPTRELHLEMRDAEKFVLTWKEAGKDVRPSSTLARVDRVEHVGAVKVMHFPGLSEKIRAEWTEMGMHTKPGDRDLDRVVLHTDDASPYSAIVGAMDAVHGVTRPMQVGAKTSSASAFHVTFATK